MTKLGVTPEQVQAFTPAQLKEFGLGLQAYQAGMPTPVANTVSAFGGLANIYNTIQGSRAVNEQLKQYKRAGKRAADAYEEAKRNREITRDTFSNFS
jgi:hypothetical protein